MGEAFFFHLQAGANGLEDAHIGLVQRVEVHILRLELVGLEHLADIPQRVGDRELVDLLTLHLQILGRGGVDGKGAVARGRVGAEHLVAGLAVEADVLDALALAHHRGPGGVAEQHTGAAVGPVGEAAERLGADHQQPAGATGGDQPLGHGQRSDKAGAAAV